MAYHAFMFKNTFRYASQCGLIACFSLATMAMAGPPPGSHGGPGAPMVPQKDSKNEPIPDEPATNTPTAAPKNLAKQSASTPKGWKILEPSNANVTLTVPENSKYTTTETSSLVGDVTNHIYTGNDKELIVVVDYSDIPGIAFVFTGDDSLYDQAKGSYLKDMLAKETSFKKAEYNGIKGMRLEFISPKFADHNGYKGAAFLFFVEHTLYIASVYSKEKFDDSEADRVFTSMKQTNQDKGDE